MTDKIIRSRAARETDHCFAADLGGTKLAAAMADAHGRIVAELTEPNFIKRLLVGTGRQFAKRPNSSRSPWWTSLRRSCRTELMSAGKW